MAQAAQGTETDWRSVEEENAVETAKDVESGGSTLRLDNPDHAYICPKPVKKNVLIVVIIDKAMFVPDAPENHISSKGNPTSLRRMAQSMTHIQNPVLHHHSRSPFQRPILDRELQETQMAHWRRALLLNKVLTRTRRTKMDPYLNNQYEWAPRIPQGLSFTEALRQVRMMDMDPDSHWQLISTKSCSLNRKR